MKPRIAILLPCYNEEETVAQTVRAFRKAFSEADIYVYDNNSSDQTARCALDAGAYVRYVPQQGKGFVVRRMFSDIDADIYVMADGDNTYCAPSAPKLVEKLINEQLDMVVGTRVHKEQAAYRAGHVLGNKFFTAFVSLIFGKSFTDIFSGYRVFSRRFVKTFPCLSKGFEIETELTVHALDLQLPVGEIKTPYDKRPEGSVSKLSTYKDGFKILRKVFALAKDVKPFLCFASVAGFLLLLSLIFGIPLIRTYFETGLVPRFPTAILSAGIMVMACLFFFSGLLLDSISRLRRENKILAYLRESQRAGSGKGV